MIGLLLLLAGVAYGSWQWRSSIADATESKMREDASRAYADLALSRWQTQTKLQEATDELAKQLTTHALAQAKEREKVSAAVARYASSHHPAAAVGACSHVDADWMRIFTQSIRGASEDLDSTGGSVADPHATGAPSE